MGSPHLYAAPQRGPAAGLLGFGVPFLQATTSEKEVAPAGFKGVFRPLSVRNSGDNSGTASPCLPLERIVCYQSNQDELRHHVIQWLEAEIIPVGWFSKGSNYSEVLDKYFKDV
ncbi:hypothetical protein Y1Q_0022110 [Alligator mississippiensis]|uniref:Follistatin-related protein 1 EF-hand domain-containing protein n=1 Tax=Alligator mississippiensis TaxID=8496 RepID=A0A151M4N4_ALLMI|nr:hypothetical protein Y1Q_0022110 [Alligator mississippiensis]